MKGTNWLLKWRSRRTFFRLHDVPPWQLVACFSEVCTNCMFFRVWHQFYVFPRLAPFACLPASLYFVFWLVSYAINFCCDWPGAIPWVSVWARYVMITIFTFRREEAGISCRCHVAFFCLSYIHTPPSFQNISVDRQQKDINLNTDLLTEKCARDHYTTGKIYEQLQTKRGWSQKEILK